MYSIEIGIVMYIVYNVALNWVYIKEYSKGKGLIKRGWEWEND
jgi:hypothetical protein